MAPTHGFSSRLQQRYASTAASSASTVGGTNHQNKNQQDGRHKLGVYHRGLNQLTNLSSSGLVGSGTGVGIGGSGFGSGGAGPTRSSGPAAPRPLNTSSLKKENGGQDINAILVNRQGGEFRIPLARVFLACARWRQLSLECTNVQSFYLASPAHILEYSTIGDRPPTCSRWCMVHGAWCISPLPSTRMSSSSTTEASIIIVDRSRDNSHDSVMFALFPPFTFQGRRSDGGHRSPQPRLPSRRRWGPLPPTLPPRRPR